MTGEPDIPRTTGHDPKCAQKGTPGQAGGNKRAVPPAGIDIPTIAQVEVPKLSAPTDYHTKAGSVPYHTGAVNIAPRSSLHSPYTLIATPLPYPRKAPYLQGN